MATQIERVNRAHAERYLSCSWDEDGSLVIRGRLPADDEALLLKALEAGRDGLRSAPAKAPPEDAPPATTALEGSGRDKPERTESGRHEPDPGASEHGESDPAEPFSGASGRHEPDPAESDRGYSDSDEREPGRGNADALAFIAEAALAAAESQRSGGERYQLVVHGEAAALAGDDEGHSELEHGPAIGAETARRVACDAALVAIAERDGRPLSVGRKTRTIPPALRRALRSRDRCCRFPGCNQRRFVDAHHIEHWARGGETELRNLVLLCRHHHRLVHEGGFQLERLPGGGVRCRRPDGRAVRPGRPPTRSDHHQIRARNRRVGIAIGPDTPVALDHGRRFSLEMAVEGVLAGEGLLDMGFAGA